MSKGKHELNRNRQQEDRGRQQYQNNNRDQNNYNGYRDNNRYYDNNNRKQSTGAQKTLKVLIGIFLVILVVLLVFFLRDIFTPGSVLTPGENGDDNNTVQDPADDLHPDSTPLPLRTPDPHANLDGSNPLTGAPMDDRYTRNRPIAVVLNNVPQALPMNGVADADIIFEYSVEGGLTRMLALYQDVSLVGLIGSIRSARHYTVQLAESFDAIFLCAGRSPQALTEMRNLGIPVLNEVEGPHRDVFYRDRNRIPDRRVDNVHSVVTSGDRLMHFLPGLDFRLLHENDYKHVFTFVEDGTPSGGMDAESAVVSFSSGKTTSFIHDPAEGGYYVRQADRDFTDANDNSRPVFANIIVIKTSVTGLLGDDAGRLDITTTGSGEGYFVSGGKYVEINWSRENKSAPFIYTLKNGERFDFGIGKTYICVIPTNMSAVFR